LGEHAFGELVQSVLVTSYHDLAGAVVVRNGDDATSRLRSFMAELFDSCAREAEDGKHATGSQASGRAHSQPTGPYQTERIGKTERPSGNQSAVETQAMSGNGTWTRE